MALDRKRALARPLTRTTKDGRRYVRPPEVESQLEELLHASVEEQLARVTTVEKGSQQFVRDECLVYLIREAWLADDSDRYSTLTAQLLRRCAQSILRNLWGLGVAGDDQKDLYGDVVTAMITAFLDEGGAGEFFQVRFGRTLRYLTLNVHSKYARRQKRAQKEDSLNATLAGDDELEEDGVALEERVGGREDVGTDVERRLVIREALAAIRDARHREAFVLHYYDDWQIETKDPSDPSISRRFGVTARTVRNWLTAAERDLAAWRVAQDT